MTTILQLAGENPAVFASVISAIIAASVAVLLFVLNQLLAGKQKRIQFLTPKLEELYLLLNEVSEHNVKFFKLVHLCLDGDPEAQRNLNEADDLELYGHRTAKEIVMHIRLYFPRLAPIHQNLFATQRELNDLVFLIHTDKPPQLSDVIMASGRVGHFTRLMEQEIIRNRDYLLSDHLFPKRYIKSTPEEIAAVIPPPDDPMISPDL